MKKYMKVAYLAPFSLVMAMLGFIMTLKTQNMTVKLFHSFFEAAMVGGLADWFAVVALFRHPFNIPIPHTSIIKKNRGRITNGIIDMLETQWLTKEALQSKVERFDFAAEISKIIVRHDNIKLIVDFAFGVIDNFLQKVKSGNEFSEARRVVKNHAKTINFKESLSSLINDNFLDLSSNARKMILGEADILLNSNETVSFISAEIPKILKNYIEKFPNSEMIMAMVNMGEMSGILNYNSISLEICRVVSAEISNAKSDVNHVISQKIEAAFKNLAGEILDNPDLNSNMTQVINSAVDKIDFAEVIDNLWRKLGEKIRINIADAIIEYGNRLKQEDELKNNFNYWAKDKVLIIIEEKHSEISNIVRENITKVNDDELTAQIEDKVGEDLQYIRINGAVVGGLVGVLIFILKNYLI